MSEINCLRSISGNRIYITSTFSFFFRHMLYMSKSRLVKFFDLAFFIMQLLFLKNSKIKLNNTTKQEIDRLSNSEFEFSLINTSWYKNSNFIGVIENPRSKYFIKSFKEEDYALLEYHNYQTLEKSIYSKYFKLPEVRISKRNIFLPFQDIGHPVDYNDALRLINKINAQIQPTNTPEALIRKALQAIENNIPTAISFADSILNDASMSWYLSHGDYKCENLIGCAKNGSDSFRQISLVDYENVGIYSKNYDKIHLISESYFTEPKLKNLDDLLDTLLNDHAIMENQFWAYIIIKYYQSNKEATEFKSNKLLENRLLKLKKILESL